MSVRWMMEGRTSRLSNIDPDAIGGFAVYGESDIYVAASAERAG